MKRWKCRANIIYESAEIEYEVEAENYLEALKEAKHYAADYDEMPLPYMIDIENCEEIEEVIVKFDNPNQIDWVSEC
jgi:hypothetical protein